MSATLRTQCAECPWRTVDHDGNTSDPSLPFTPETIDAARAGVPFTCHTRMGPCDGPSYAGLVTEEAS